MLFGKHHTISVAFFLLVGSVLSAGAAPIRHHKPARHTMVLPSRHGLSARQQSLHLLQSRSSVPLSAKTALSDPLSWSHLMAIAPPTHPVTVHLPVAAPPSLTATSLAHHASSQALAHHLQAASLSYQQGQYDEAIQQYNMACQLCPKDSALREKIGDLYYLAKQYPQASQEYRDAIRISPMAAEAHWGLGITLLNTPQQASAGIAECRTALRLKPNDGTMHNALGLALYEQGMKQAAHTEWQQTLQLDNGEAAVTARHYLSDFPD